MKARIAQRFARATAYDDHATVQKKICHDLAAQIAPRHLTRVLEIGAGDGGLTRLLLATVTAQQWVINDLCPAKKNRLAAIAPQATIHIGDAENHDWGQDFDLLISANTVQWFTHPLAFPQAAARALRTGGQLLFNTFLPAHFQEIRALTGQGLPYPRAERWAAALAEDFEAVTLTPWQETLYFPDPRAVLGHLQATGVTGVAAWRWKKSTWRAFMRDYPRTAAGCPLTYQALLMNGRKKKPVE